MKISIATGSYLRVFIKSGTLFIVSFYALRGDNLVRVLSCLEMKSGKSLIV